MKTFRIAVYPGDGIGSEVIAEAVRVLEAAQTPVGFGIQSRVYLAGAKFLLHVVVYLLYTRYTKSLPRV